MSEAEYHARPELSSTEARRILDSPAKYRWFKDHPQKHESFFDAGSSVHAKVLGTGYGVVELDYPDWRTKAAQQERDDVRAEGKIPMLKKDMVEVNLMSESVLAHPIARALFEQPGQAEASVFYTDPLTGVDMRARFDYLPHPTDRRRVATDLKTTSGKADPSGFAKSAASYGYDVQRGHYLETLEDDSELVFVVVEKEPPYLVGVHQLAPEFASMGEVKAKRARELFAECTASGKWPGYPEQVQLVTAPVWSVYEFQDKYES
ncbi:PD-(D/E)XK nuclease-like domain-containing protein [Gryllotalpicola koreensis]|uniref:Putative exodeoxyribonuclease 8 PDDEXK-like domain-containing protein n=1 Tax=Gryllotalpicola koreensis TaxID=993086 RepID=A0ABP8A254_9MICO